MLRYESLPWSYDSRDGNRATFCLAGLGYWTTCYLGNKAEINKKKLLKQSCLNICPKRVIFPTFIIYAALKSKKEKENRDKAHINTDCVSSLFFSFESTTVEI